VVSVFTVSNTQWGGNHWNSIIESDGKGYYSYLPAAFIFNDLHFGFHDSIEKKYYSPQTYSDYRVPMQEGTVNKYFAGTAMLQFPFFIIGHSITKITGGECDGFSYWYQIAISIAGIFYFLIGLRFTEDFLKLCFIEEKYIQISTLLFAFGTNLFYYALFEPAMSHIYSFFCIAVFLYTTLSFLRFRNSKLLFWIFPLLGLIFIIRPVNLFIIFIIPFLLHNISFRAFIVKLFINKKMLIYSILFSLIIISVQSVFYYKQIHKIWVYAYLQEGFQFSKFNLNLFLFSYRKGLFVYTPLLFISMIGLALMFRKDLRRFIQIFSFLLALLYLLSCWWMWWYGGSFGMRPVIEFYPVFIFLAAYAMQQSSVTIRKTIYILGMVCILLNQFQTYQYRYLRIHWSDMNKAKYWNSYLDFK
jgi:hypothetical protein